MSSVIDADRFDAYCFSAEIKTEDQDYHLQHLWGELSTQLDQYLSTFPHDTEIGKLRREISVTCKNFSKHLSGIYRLCVPTGGGKTLSSLRYALDHARIYDKKRIIFAIPYTTIIDQNAKVIREALGCDDIILEHHSNLIPDEEDSHEMAGRIKSELLTERCDSPIILTTTVQLLNTLLLGKTRSVRRMHNLANSIIILDEVQAIPIKCLGLFNTAMNFLAEFCSTTIILCTATQPELTTVPHPIRLSQPSDMLENLPEVFQKFKRTEIRDVRTPRGYTMEELADFTLEKWQENSSVLVIMNTTRSAKNLYATLKNRLINAELYYQYKTLSGSSSAKTGNHQGKSEHPYTHDLRNDAAY